MTPKTFETVWKLASTIRDGVIIENFSASKLYNTYSEISPKNKYYKEAQLECYFLITQADVDCEETELQYKKLAFQHTLAHGDQQLIDNFFNELCGYSGFNPNFTDIKLNVETIMALAVNIRTLNKHKLGSTENNEKNNTPTEGGFLPP